MVSYGEIPQRGGDAQEPCEARGGVRAGKMPQGEILQGGEIRTSHTNRSPRMREMDHPRSWRTQPPWVSRAVT